MDGTATVVSAVAHRHGEPHWKALLAGGIVGVAAGALTLFVPGLTIYAVVLLVGAWALVMGAFEIAAAIRLRREIAGEWMFILAGAVAIAFGLLVFAAPAAGAIGIVLWIGAYALISGGLLFVFSLRLRSWGHAHAAA